MTFAKSLITSAAAIIVFVSASQLWAGITPLPGGLGTKSVWPTLRQVAAPDVSAARSAAAAALMQADALRWEATRAALQSVAEEAAALKIELVAARADLAALRISAAAWRNRSERRAPPAPAAALYGVKNGAAAGPAIPPGPATKKARSLAVARARLPKPVLPETPPVAVRPVASPSVSEKTSPPTPKPKLASLPRRSAEPLPSVKRLVTIAPPARPPKRKAAPEPVAAAPPPDMKALARKLQQQLARVGCDPGAIDGIWGRKSRQALREFANETGKPISTGQPSAAAVRIVSNRSARACPLNCGADERIVKGRCIAKPARTAKSQSLAKPAGLGLKRRSRPAPSSPPPQPAAGKSWINEIFEDY